MKSYTNLTIKEWASEDRPREKLLTKGVSVLSNAELIAILLSTGTKKISAVDLAKYILSSVDNNLYKLGKLSVSDLIKIDGIGEAKAITIIAALELGRRRKDTVQDINYIKDSKSVFNIFQPKLGDLLHEEFWVLYLNRANKIIGEERISSGGISGTVIDVKIIIKYGIDKLSSGIILVHNHPSGNINPSKNDKEITRKISSASKLMDIITLDHIIIGGDLYFSFADEGMIN